LLTNESSGFMTRSRFVQLGLFIFSVLLVPRQSWAQQLSTAELLEQYNTTKLFWQQFEVAKKLVWNAGIPLFLGNSAPGWRQRMDI
jgi:hypothetical protein